MTVLGFVLWLVLTSASALAGEEANATAPPAPSGLNPASAQDERIPPHLRGKVMTPEQLRDRLGPALQAVPDDSPVPPQLRGLVHVPTPEELRRWFPQADQAQ